MLFWKDIVFPVILAIVVIFLIVFALKLILNFFTLDIPIIKFGGAVAIWYYIGPIIYNWLVTKIITTPKDGIEIIYRPIQCIIEAFEKLV